MKTKAPHKRAVTIAIWFSAAFAVFFSALAMLSLAGVVGHQRDVLYALFMAGAGALLFAAAWLALRFA